MRREDNAHGHAARAESPLHLAAELAPGAGHQRAAEATADLGARLAFALLFIDAAVALFLPFEMQQVALLAPANGQQPFIAPAAVLHRIGCKLVQDQSQRRHLDTGDGHILAFYFEAFLLRDMRLHRGFDERAQRCAAFPA